MLYTLYQLYNVDYSHRVLLSVATSPDLLTVCIRPPPESSCTVETKTLILLSPEKNPLSSLPSFPFHSLRVRRRFPETPLHTPPRPHYSGVTRRTLTIRHPGRLGTVTTSPSHWIPKGFYTDRLTSRLTYTNLYPPSSDRVSISPTRFDPFGSDLLPGLRQETRPHGPSPGLSRGSYFDQPHPEFLPSSPESSISHETHIRSIQRPDGRNP